MTVFKNNLERLLSEAYEEPSYALKEISHYLENMGVKRWASKNVTESLLLFFFIFEKEFESKLSIFYALLLYGSQNPLSFIRQDRAFNMFTNDLVKQINFLHMYVKFTNNDFNLSEKDFNLFHDIIEYHRPVIVQGYYIGLSQESSTGLLPRPITTGSKLTKDILKEGIVSLSERYERFDNKTIKSEFKNVLDNLIKNFDKLRVN